MRSVAKKIFILFGCITLITLSVIPIYAHAQEINPDPYAVERTRQKVKELAEERALKNPTEANLKAAAESAKLAEQAKAAPTTDSSLGWFGNQILNVINLLLFMVLKVMSALLAIAGLFLDEIIKMTIVNMAENIKGISAINDVWGKIRDLGNMTFIFILLYQGIRMILGLGGTSVKKAITGIIIAAIFVNFSLFVTKAVIDASNIITLGFYNSISNAGGGNINIALIGNKNFGFSGAFMKPLGLTGLWSTDGFQASTKDQGSAMLIYIGGSIFLLITLFAFLVIALLFIIRYMVFILLLIMSPIAFLSFALPGLGSLSKQFWDTLMGQALFGPVYMILTWVTLSIAGSDGFLRQAPGGIGKALAEPNPDSISLIINFIILIGLIIFSILQAKKWATSGGIVSASYISKGEALLGGAVFGGAAALGRGTVGAAAYKMSNNSDLRARAAAGDKFAQLQLKTLKGVASSSFDARKGFIGETAQKKMGVDFGKGSLFNSKNTGEKGYAGKVERRAKEEAEYIKSLKPTKDEEDEARARAKATMNSDAFKQEEQARKDKYFNAEYRAEVDARRKPLEAALNLANVEKETVEKNIKESEKEIEDTQKIIDNLKNQSGLDPIARQARKDAEKKLASQLEALKNSKELAEQKKKASIKAQEELETFNKKEKEEEDSWESEDLKKLIAYSGGRKGVKGKKDIDAISEYQRIATEAAEVFDEKAGASIFTKAWNGNSVLNKKIADKIRAESKAKSDEQQLAEIIKKQAKEAKEAEEAKGKASKPEGDSGEGNKEKTT